MATGGKITIHSVPINEPKDQLIKPEEAREALVEAIKAIPAERLKNFRGGQITIVS